MAPAGEIAYPSISVIKQANNVLHLVSNPPVCTLLLTHAKNCPITKKIYRIENMKFD